MRYTLTRPAAGGSRGRGLDSEELVQMMRDPGALEEVREIMRKLLNDPVRRSQFNATIGRINAAKHASSGDDDSDAFASLLANPQDLVGLLQDPGKVGELAGSFNTSVVFKEMRELGSLVLEQLRVGKLPAGELVEIYGLQAQAELNSQTGALADPTPEEARAFEGRRIVCLEGDAGRVALRPENLRFPRYQPGDAVTLEAEFGGAEEGLEGRAAVVSELTEEELRLGFKPGGGRVVVDVLPTVPGGPVVHRLLMWCDHLRPRTFAPGDSVELAGLDSDAGLNGLPATVVPATAEEAAAARGANRVVVATDEGGVRLAVPRRNLRLLGIGPPRLRGLG